MLPLEIISTQTHQSPTGLPTRTATSGSLLIGLCPPHLVRLTTSTVMVTRTSPSILVSRIANLLTIGSLLTYIAVTYGQSLVIQGRSAILANYNRKQIAYARGTQDKGDDSSNCAPFTAGVRHRRSGKRGPRRRRNDARSSWSSASVCGQLLWKR
jgi:hypothetical protein